MQSRHVCGRKDTVYRSENRFIDPVYQEGATTTLQSKRKLGKDRGEPTKVWKLHKNSKSGIVLYSILETSLVSTFEPGKCCRCTDNNTGHEQIEEENSSHESLNHVSTVLSTNCSLYISTSRIIWEWSTTLLAFMEHRKWMSFWHLARVNLKTRQKPNSMAGANDAMFICGAIAQKQ